MKTLVQKLKWFDSLFFKNEDGEGSLRIWYYGATTIIIMLFITTKGAW